jgi:hypothetical protein
MPRIKSIIIRVEIDEVQKAHNCQASATHRLVRGDKRLKVRNGRSRDHYCVPCAIAILERDIAELQTLQRRVQSTQAQQRPQVWCPRLTVAAGKNISLYFKHLQHLVAVVVDDLHGNLA